jgi:hypothetical protein
MRFPKPIDETLHGATDYMVGTTLTTVFPRLVGVTGTRSARQIRASGVAHLAYSAITDYPLGVVKALPYKAHLAVDALGAIAIAATPFVTGQYRQGRRQWVPHVALAAFELGSLLMSDPSGQGDFHGDVEAVREANQADPSAAIRGGGRAVQPAVV